MHARLKAKSYIACNGLGSNSRRGRVQSSNSKLRVRTMGVKAELFAIGLEMGPAQMHEHGASVVIADACKVPKAGENIHFTRSPCLMPGRTCRSTRPMLVTGLHRTSHCLLSGKAHGCVGVEAKSLARYGRSGIDKMQSISRVCLACNDLLETMLIFAMGDSFVPIPANSD